MIRGALWLTSGLFLLVGCDAGRPKHPTTRLEGKVTLDGEPLKTGSIQFRPQNQESSPVVQAEIRDGRYTAPDVPLGNVLVLIQATRETGKVVVLYGQSSPEVVNVIPERYRRGIPLEVKADHPAQDFPLSSKPSP